MGENPRDESEEEAAAAEENPEEPLQEEEAGENPAEEEEAAEEAPAEESEEEPGEEEEREEEQPEELEGAAVYQTTEEAFLCLHDDVHFIVNDFLPFSIAVLVVFCGCYWFYRTFCR